MAPSYKWIIKMQEPAQPMRSDNNAPVDGATGGAHRASLHGVKQDLHGITSSSSSMQALDDRSISYQQYLKLRTVAIGLIDQGIGLLEHTVNSDHRLTAVSVLVPGSTIGKHLRSSHLLTLDIPSSSHLHDHFRILFHSALDQKTINYDARDRNVPMESSQQICLQEFIKLKRRYLQDPRSQFNRNTKPLPSPSHHHHEEGHDQSQQEGLEGRSRSSSLSSSSSTCFNHDQEMELVAITPLRVCLKTSFNRELWFACLHATHHYALIRVIVTGELNLELAKEFGVAPSTLERSKV
ncbi:hypothetical protein VP01_1624g1 [Puccinia sorghi]|uniref:Uncharacterized protein n=1 Tax=Puccinia sorghi TaxID=27349 RepID=A0A0L6VIT2_9BASI|nr:hypothetical protein VP01_1624g1 [Puccinia sorghi]